ncbi:MAG: DUF192 domain-containing protein, partial [Gemmatimonadales bacterium]
VLERSAGDDLEIEVEVAKSQEQRTRGLGRRDALDDDAGMIFLFEEMRGGDEGFWMFRTRIPLDIAFLDEDGTILDILGMDPCESPNPEFCPVYSPGVPYQFALEMNLGWFQAHDVAAGDRVDLGSLDPDDAEPAPAQPEAPGS